ncbi:hypothetical protein C2G38_2214711 [Gigaspora rosea]|uniref:Uncharacterized protein n=1 Tax=Gigaspora rosea TaxID=44941 RepID=A0A397UEX8_9GLOM|nr:hypothetical protein C2G38_2214711 [Gigaspora rosea]
MPTLDLSTKTETATTNSNNVHGSIVTEILPAKNRPIQWEETLSLTMQGKLYGIHVPPRHFMKRSIVSKINNLFKYLPQVLYINDSDTTFTGFTII